MSKKQISAGLWTLFLSAFFAVGLNSLIQVVDLRVFPSSAKYVSSDRYLLAILGVPHASERIKKVLDTLPTDAPILFVGPQNKNASLTFCLLSSLALPRIVVSADLPRTRGAGIPDDFKPSAVAFFQVPPPLSAKDKVEFGPLKFVRVEGDK